MAGRLTPQEQYDAERLFSLSGSYDKASLKKAYLQKMREWHPDVAARHGHTTEEAEAMTKSLNNALVALMSLFVGNTKTVQCVPAPTAGTTGTTSHATRNATGQAQQARTGADAQAATGRGGWTPYETVADEADEPTGYEHVGRGATPKNMDATIRYTRIVTDSRFIRWFVAGIGPHIVWAVASFVFLFACGALMTGVLGPGGIAMMTQLLPIFVLYDIVSNRGAEVVLSVADIWAVNKAVNGTM